MRSLFLFLVSLTLFSCRDIEDIPTMTPDGEAPICTGVNRIYEDGTMGQPIGKPDNSHKEGMKVKIRGAFPTPCLDHFQVSFESYRQQSIKVWVKRCKASNYLARALNSLGCIFYKPSGLADFIVMDEELEAGYYRVVVITEKIAPNNQSGFFRIYLQTREELLWTDTWFVNEFDRKRLENFRF